MFFYGFPVSKIRKAKVFDGKNSTLSQNSDGAYCADYLTGTKIYYGADASHYIEHLYEYPKNTEIIAQSKTKLKLSCPEGGFVLDEPGAILIKKGTKCHVETLEGNPLVIQYDKKPDWYDDLRPDNVHSEFFATLARKNHELYACGERKPISSYQNPGEVEEKDFWECPYWSYS